MKRVIYLFLFLFFTSFLVVQQAVAQNIALGKNAVASSVEPGAYTSYANDSQGSTRWSSSYTDNEWIYIDLAQMYNLTQVVLTWETASGKDFNIQVSNDALSWTDVAVVTNNASLNNTFNFSATARYVRMLGITRNTGFGYSLWEFEIYGSIVTPLGLNIASGKTATASSSQNPSVTEDKAVDGQGNASNVDYMGGCTGSCTFWASNNNNDPEWLYIDLGSLYELRQVVVYWRFNANDFNIQVSDDALSWTDVITYTDNQAFANTFNMNNAVGRYVRVLGLSRNVTDYELYEVEVYGALSTLPVKLSNFTAKATNTNSVAINWNASIDLPSTFEIQRSTNGVDYTTIGTVNETVAFAGSRSYSYQDKTPAAGRSYYRLKYWETGGPVHYSPIASVTFGNNASFSVYPNPAVANRNLTINLATPYTGTLQLRFINLAGMTVYTQSISSVNRTKFEIVMNKAIQSGSYLLEVSTGTSSYRSRVIVMPQ